VTQERTAADGRPYKPKSAAWLTQHIRKTSWRALHRVIYTTSRLEFLPNRLVAARNSRGVRAPAQRPVRGTSPRYGDITPARSVQAGGMA